MAVVHYIAGPSRLGLTGHADLIQPGEPFDHDFGPEGPEGEHGPAREAAMIAAGAMTRADAVDAVPAAKTTSTKE